MTRRGFLSTAAAGALGIAGMGLYARYIEPHWVEVVRRPLPIRDLPDGLVGKRLVQLSDIHVGSLVDSEYLVRSMRSLAALQPDMIVITGDILTTPDLPHHREVLRVLEQLPLAPLGVFAVLGNHDYGRAWGVAECANTLSEALNDRDIRVLRNEVVEVRGLQLVGIDDYWGTNFQPREAVRLVDPRRPLLTLCHNPDVVDLPIMRQLPGWVLSGHTHGGQVKPPFLPPPILPVNNRRYTCGAFELSDSRQMYINRGLGYVRLVRFNVRPEITLFTLARA